MCARMRWDENTKGWSLRNGRDWLASRCKESDTSLYHLRPIPCCILAGDTDGGGLDMLIPVVGLTIGIAFRTRVAAGWWILRLDDWFWYPEGIYGFDAELREKLGVTCCGCCVGDESGEPLDSDERSEDEEWIDTNYEIVRWNFKNLKEVSWWKVPPYDQYRWYTYVAFRQQGWTELHVIIQVEGPPSLKLLSESCDWHCVGQLLHTSHSSELFVWVLGGGETRSPTRTTAVMGVRRRCRAICRGGMLMSIIMIVWRHYRCIWCGFDTIARWYWMKKWRIWRFRRCC